MARKCVVCGKWITESDETVPYKKRYAHKDCFNSAIKMIRKDKNEELKKKEEEKKNNKSKTKKATVKAELKDGLSDEEYKEKRSYYEYVKNLANVDKLSAKIYVLSEKYVEQYGFTWKGMKNTLVYLNEIKEIELTGDIVGIIPHCYDEAMGFYEEVKSVEENNKDKNVSRLYSERVVRIKPPKRVIKQLSFDD